MDMFLTAKLASELEKKGWRIEPSAKSFNIAEHTILSRYPGLDIEYIGFLSSFSRLESGDECSWFLFPDDFKENADPNGFAWNEFEQISAEAALSDSEVAAVKEWWSCHLPVLLSVRGGYSFYAIDIGSRRVVYGTEPEFEETSVAAESFEDFLKKIISGKISL